MSATVKMECELLDAHYSKIVNDRPIAHFALRGFDDLVGGVKPGRMTILAGEPGTAKTTLFGQLADDLAEQGMPIIFFSFELDPSALVAKSLLRIVGGLPEGDVAESYLGESGRRLIDGARDTYRCCIAQRIAYVDQACSPVEMAAFVSDVETKTGVKPAVFVDYLQICEAEGVADERLAIKHIVGGLRALANSYGVPVYAISSVSRQGYAKGKSAKTGLDVLGGCSYIEYSADTVLHLSADVGASSSCDGGQSRFLVLRALKNRYGAVGSSLLELRPAAATFLDRSEA